MLEGIYVTELDEPCPSGIIDDNIETSKMLYSLFDQANAICRNPNILASFLSATQGQPCNADAYRLDDRDLRSKAFTFVGNLFSSVFTAHIVYDDV